MEPVQANSSSAVVEELEKAEEDHLKNCPNAEFSLRMASVVVDGILTYVAISGTHKLSNTIDLILVHFLNSSTFNSLNLTWGEVLKNNSSLVSGSVEIGLKVLFVYFYFICSTNFYGGTPGKLLMGLRVLKASSGKKLRQGEALYRLSLALITNVFSCGVSYLAMNLREDRTTYHDRISETKVKKVHGVR